MHALITYQYSALSRILSVLPAVVAVVIACPLTSAAQQQNGQPFQFLFSGYHKIHFETADRQRFGSEYPATFLRWELQPTVGVYGCRCR
jgi:hypothetical protein